MCAGIAALIYSSVMGHYASCIVYERVAEFQTDPSHLPQYTQFNLVPQAQIWTVAIHTWIIQRQEKLFMHVTLGREGSQMLQL